MRQLLSCPCLLLLINWEATWCLLSLCTVLWIQAILFQRDFTLRSSVRRHLSLTTTCPTGYWSFQVLSGQDELPTALLPTWAIHQARLLSTSFSAPNGGSFDAPVPSSLPAVIVPPSRRTVKLGLFSSFPPVKEIFFPLEETTEVFADQVSGDQSTGSVSKGNGSDQLPSEAWW